MGRRRFPFPFLPAPRPFPPVCAACFPCPDSTAVRAESLFSSLGFAVYQSTTWGLTFLPWSPTAIIISTCHQGISQIDVNTPGLGYLFLYFAWGFSMKANVPPKLAVISKTCLPQFTWDIWGCRWCRITTSVWWQFTEVLCRAQLHPWGGVLSVSHSEFSGGQGLGSADCSHRCWQAACLLTLLSKVTSSWAETLFC